MRMSPAIRGTGWGLIQRAFRARGGLQIGAVNGEGQRVGVARLSRRAHNPETDCSNQSPATNHNVNLIVNVKVINVF